MGRYKGRRVGLCPVLDSRDHAFVANPRNGLGLPPTTLRDSLPKVS